MFRNNRLDPLKLQLLKGFALATILLVSTLAVPLLLSPLAKATSWNSSVALPGTDPNTNLFPSMLQTSNSSAGHGAMWLVWEKVTTTSSGMIYLMTHNRYGWSGQSPLVSDTNDNIAPALGELANGTIILVWSRGTGSHGTYDLYWKGYNGTRWTSISPLVQGHRDNFTPSLARSSDGTVWLAWSRSNSTNGGGDIFFETYNGTWSSSKALVFTGAQERFPNVVQMSDGRVWVSYTSNAGGNDQLWDIIWNGASWSAPAQLTSTANPDDYPFLIEDRSGGVWAFWIRQLPTSDPTNPIQDDLFYKNSTNLGATWGPEVQIAVPQFTNSDEFHPTVVQSVDKTLWIVYASNQAISNPYSTYNLYVLQSTLIKGHDVAVTGIKVTPPSAFTNGLVPANPRQGEMVQVYVTVTNLGDYNETVLTLTASTNYGLNIGSTTISALPAGNVITYDFSWNSTGMPLGYYTVLAAVSPVPGEVTTSNNQLSSGFLLVSPGDANRDGVVNISDLVTIAVRFGLSVGNPLYTPDADLNHDGTINIKDLVICAVNFGTGVKIHYIAVTGIKVTPPPAFTSGLVPGNPRQGEVAQISVTVSNLGDYNETGLTLTASINSGLSLGSTSISSLLVGKSNTFVFTWNSTGMPLGNYMVLAAVSPVPGEVTTNGNQLSSSFLLVSPGDANRDGVVNISDLVMIGVRFGLSVGNPLYTPDADLNHDGTINIKDLVICSVNFGVTG